MYATPEQSVAWLRARMSELDLGSLDQVAERCGSDKGNISRIFHQQQRPRVVSLESLAEGLDIGIYELLVRIGAVDPEADPNPVRRKDGRRMTFAWPRRSGASR